ncbi:Gfo/Idh/MocA family oxidoreductase [Panacibacter sp. DH6]|uniref:Gfo/Idh/MocA family oxidoreductase n=1 Tax=Panacibacter microcysteis TaxID=2793269 RepID=A0A931E4L0_9BACT|nr:Gfo/Idh/MocA family oxidoreductase [Panacibacter microcysteis]MBG9376052.1 Gfo/Idh/MocA family oxidoreductase [Panacibacter microcysteis]
MNRRKFLRGTSATLALASLQANGMINHFTAPPRRVALIGTGWYGKSDLFRLMQVAPVEVAGLCDVDKHQLDNAAAMVMERQQVKKKPALYGDYRKLLQEIKPEIVLIGTPDHWHALTMIEAVKSGANVYVQKPISVDVMEGEAMVAAARKYNRVVQVGTQRRSTPHLLDAKKNVVDAGLLGKVSHVEMCCYYHMRNNGNPPVTTVPDFFDYEMWTGPAPMRPFDEMPHVRWWRAFMEYGNGIMGDMCIHMFDAVRWLLRLGWPKRITSTGGIYVDKTGKSNIADTQTALFEYDDLNCSWTHRSWGTPADPEYPWAFKIYGDKGTLCGSTMQYDFIPADKGQKIHKDVVYEKEKYPADLKEPQIELNAAPATRLHMLNFLDAIDKKIKPVADIEEGHISTASCIMANLSMKLGRPLSYDPLKREIIGDAAATKLLQRQYRAPWAHPHPDNV